MEKQNTSKNGSKSNSSSKPIQSSQITSTTTNTQDRYPILSAALAGIRK